MFATPDFNPFKLPAGRDRQHFAPASIETVETAPEVSQIYDAAWTIAQRDYELNRLFNADYYQGRDI